MRITEKGVHPVIDIHAAKEHGYPHCHVGERGVKVYVFTDGIVPTETLSRNDLRFIYGYYDKMIQKFDELEWDVVPCPAEHRDNLFNG